MVAESLLGSTGICIIQDTFQSDCSVLFDHYLQIWSSSKQPFIVVFALANPIDRVIKSVKSAEMAIIIDCFSDSNGWDSTEETVKTVDNSRCRILNCNNSNSLEHLESLFRKALTTMKSKGGNISVMIDSLGVLMVNHSASRIRQFLQKIYSICDTKKSRVVGVLHSDAMLAQDLSQLEFGVDTVVKVQQPMAMLEELPGQKKVQSFLTQTSALRSQRLLVIRHDRPSGRVAWATEGYGMDTDGNLVSMKVPKDAPVEVNVDDTPNIDPTANLTFNLKLTEKEQSAKDKLILPYMHHLDESSNDPSKPGSSIIYYDSDEEDYDEEDPDDDLDI